MTDIDVACAAAGTGWVCNVRVRDERSATSHDVTAGAETTTAGDAERLVRETFMFLLEREPKESILRTFDLEVVGRYFPEYDREIRRRLAR